MIHYYDLFKQSINMKKTTLILVVFLLVITFIFILRNTFVSSLKKGETEGDIPQHSDTPQSKISQTIEINVEDKNIKVSWFIVSPKNLYLYPNFTEKLSAKNLKKQNNCQSLVSGGFYTQNNTPTGLFVSEGRQLTSYMRNQLFNGVFSVNYEDSPLISLGEPEDKIRIGLQTGPLLIQDKNTLNLSLVNDEQARRVVAGITESGNIIFLIFYDRDSVFTGPKLENMPNAVIDTSSKIGLPIVDAINLDGGSASAFFSPDTSLSELTFIGSYFCNK